MGTYLVTGATRGIGAAVADRLGDHELVLAGRDRAAVEAACARRRSARPLVADLADVAGLAPAVAALDLDRLDGLVHCAGVVDLAPVAAATPDGWTRTLAVNLVAPAELTRLLLPALRRVRGRVVFVGSSQSLAASPGWSAYAASKFGLRALADALRAEEAAAGVRVSSVFPGRTATDMQRQVRRQEGGEYDPAGYLRPETVAGVIADVLAAPADAVLTEVTVRPAPAAT